VGVSANGTSRRGLVRRGCLAGDALSRCSPSAVMMGATTVVKSTVRIRSPRASRSDVRAANFGHACGDGPNSRTSTLVAKGCGERRYAGDRPNRTVSGSCRNHEGVGELLLARSDA
jgi:hypothetical protein